MQRIDTLTKTFHAYSPAFSTDRAAETLDAGGKVLLPQSFLQDVTRASLVYPLQMLIQTRYRKFVYCGVLSFVAPEGQIIMPYWMLQHLQIEEGTVVQLQTCSLPKASIIKLRPHEKLFTELSNPRAVLEASLKHHTCLTRGTTIAVSHVGQTFSIDVLDIKNAAGQDEKGVLVVDSDVKVEFERPLDMPPSPPRSPVQAPFNFANAIVNGAAGGASTTASSSAVGGGGGLTFGSGYKPPAGATAPTASSSEMPKMPTLEPKFTAFKGTGKNLKGEVVTNSTAAAAAAAGASSSSNAVPPTPPPSASSNAPVGGRTLGSSGGGAANPALLALQRRMAAAAAAGNAAAAPTASSAAAPPLIGIAEGSATPSATTAGATEDPAAAPPAFVPFGGTGRKLKE